MAGHRGTDGNETADQLARQGSSHLLTGSEPALGTSSKVVMGAIRDWTGRKVRSIGSPYVDRSRLMGSLKRPSAKRAGEFLKLSRNQLRIITWQFIFKDIETGAGRQSCV
jgi:hypothetical protein